MSNRRICNVCNRSVLSHSRVVKCTTCPSVNHIQCLPFFNDDDVTHIVNSNSWSCPQCNTSLFPFNCIEHENEFLNIITNSGGNHSFTLEELDEKIFCPFNFTEQDTSSPLSDNDPDLNYYNQFSSGSLSNSSYFSENTFTKNVENDPSLRDKFSLFHLNIRSAPKNLHELTNFFSVIDFKFSAVGLTETWFSDTNCDLYTIDDYQHIYYNRKDRCGGGVSLFLKNDITYNERTDLDISNDIFESIFVEIKKE